MVLKTIHPLNPIYKEYKKGDDSPSLSSDAIKDRG
jgi:hypothetical protein